jgi:hypothetical protein
MYAFMHDCFSAFLRVCIAARPGQALQTQFTELYTRVVALDGRVVAALDGQVTLRNSALLHLCTSAFHFCVSKIVCIIINNIS